MSTLRRRGLALGTALVLTAMIFALGACSSSSDPSSSSPTLTMQSSSTASTAVLFELLINAAQSVEEFTWNGGGYDNGWWSVNFSLTLRSGDYGDVSLQGQFKDCDGNVVQLPFWNICSVQVVADFAGQVIGQNTQLGVDIKVSRDEAYEDILTVSGAGDVVFSTVSGSFSSKALTFDLDTFWPTGQIDIAFNELTMGDWTAMIVFDGDSTAYVWASDGEYTMEFTIDLETMQISG